MEQPHAPLPLQQCTADGLALSPVYRWLGVLLYLVFLFIVVVILLNMLIAAMADTYSNVQSDAQRDLALARAWIVARVEHNSMLRIVRNAPTHLLCVQQDNNVIVYFSQATT